MINLCHHSNVAVDSAFDELASCDDQATLVADDPIPLNVAQKITPRTHRTLPERVELEPLQEEGEEDGEEEGNQERNGPATLATSDVQVLTLNRRPTVNCEQPEAEPSVGLHLVSADRRLFQSNATRSGAGTKDSLMLSKSFLSVSDLVELADLRPFAKNVQSVCVQTDEPTTDVCRRCGLPPKMPIPQPGQAMMPSIMESPRESPRRSKRSGGGK